MAAAHEHPTLLKYSDLTATWTPFATGTYARIHRLYFGNSTGTVYGPDIADGPGILRIFLGITDFASQFTEYGPFTITNGMRILGGGANGSNVHVTIVYFKD